MKPCDRHNIVEKEIDDLKVVVNGDGNNKRGHAIRIAILEHDSSIAKWAAMIAAAAAISQIVLKFFGK
jgi:hypothetical protein